jgi:hypothetical protein
MYTAEDRLSKKSPIPDRIEAELDARLLPLWLHAWEIQGWDLTAVGPFLRLAYGMGYHDALTEGRRGTLYQTLGQSVPRREKL